MNSIASCSNNNWMNKYKNCALHTHSKGNRNKIVRRHNVRSPSSLSDQQHQHQPHHHLGIFGIVQSTHSIPFRSDPWLIRSDTRTSVIKDNLFVDNLLLTICNKYVLAYIVECLGATQRHATSHHIVLSTYLRWNKLSWCAPCMHQKDLTQPI